MNALNVNGADRIKLLKEQSSIASLLFFYINHVKEQLINYIYIYKNMRRESGRLWSISF